MPSSIFGKQASHNPMQGLMQIASMLKGNDPQVMMNMMMQQNPQFAAWMRENQGKTPEQIASANGIDINTLRNLLK